MLDRTTTSDPCAADLEPVAANVVSPAEIRIVRPPPSGERLVVPTAYDPKWTLGGLQSVSFAGLNSFVSNGRARDVELSTARAFAHDYMLGALGLLLVLASSILVRRPTDSERVAVAPPLAASSQLWVVVPTYNEAGNLEHMVGALVALFDKARLDGRILVVDDDSPDGTGVLADGIAKREERVDVLHRGVKEGLGPAYVAGFRHALERGAALVVQMDCDFSHDPNDVLRLVAAAGECDVVLGSRYVRGGAVHDWGLGRRLLSRAGCFYARRVLALPIRDLTGGFKCFRREALERIELGSIRASGYGFQIETTLRARRAGLVVRELPIVFRDRTNGSSKMTPRIGLEALILVPQLRLATAGRRRPGAAPAETQAAAAAS